MGCATAAHVSRPTDGGIAGVARDRESGDTIARVDIHLRAEGEMRAIAAASDATGHYQIAHVRPGRYTLTAEFAGQPIDVEHIDVRAGDTTVVDLVFTLGQPDRIHVEFGNARDGEIERYKSPRIAAQLAVIEGTLLDVSTRAPVAGASVSATAESGTQLAVTDADGRFRFDAVPPGVYTVSAYYSIGGRGQLEIRRGAIEVAGGHGVIVPLWVELARP
jgi:hypothetical protein